MCHIGKLMKWLYEGENHVINNDMKKLVCKSSAKAYTKWYKYGLVGCFEVLCRFSNKCNFSHIATWKQEITNLWNRSCETRNRINSEMFDFFFFFERSAILLNFDSQLFESINVIIHLISKARILPIFLIISIKLCVLPQKRLRCCHFFTCTSLHRWELHFLLTGGCLSIAAARARIVYFLPPDCAHCCGTS